MFLVDFLFSSKVPKISFELNYIKRNIFIILIAILMLFHNGNPVHATDKEEKSLALFQEKISSQFEKKFCNSVAFGIDKESAIKFAAGENEKEMSRKKLFSNIEPDLVIDDIALKVINSCGFSIGLSGQDGIDGFKNYLDDSTYLNYLNINK